METDNKRDKLRKMSENLRRKAIEMEEAITISRSLRLKDIEAIKELIAETEEKLSYYKQILAQAEAEHWAESLRKKKAGAQSPKDRVFAKASNGDEAEGDVATPEERAFALNRKTKAEVIESGSLLEKIRLYLCYFDDNGYADSKGKLTEEETERIVRSINGKEDADKVRGYFNEYTGLCRYGGQLRFYFKRFQTCFSALAKLLNEWDIHDRIAQRLTERAREYLSIPLNTPLEDGDEIETEEERSTLFGALLSLAYDMKDDGIFIQWDEKAKTFKANVYKQGGLYEKILQEAKDTADAMSDFKALAVAVTEFIEKSELHYTPISIELHIQNALEERYTRYLVQNLRYFRSELKPSHTSEDSKRALIPDFIETKPNREFLKEARVTLKSYVK